MAEWRDQIDWRKRSPEFIALVKKPDVSGTLRPIMELQHVTALNEAVMDLAPHPNVFAVNERRAGCIGVRYAPIAWERRRGNSQRTVANWGIQLVDAYETVRADVHKGLLGQLTRPLLKIDVGGHVRLAFLPIRKSDVLDHLAPELRRSWSRCDEPALVFAVGKLLSELSEVDDTILETVILRATSENPKHRIGSLAELRTALQPMAAKSPVRTNHKFRAWKHFDEAVGWLELEEPRQALLFFEESLKEDETFVLAEEGRDIARAQLGMPPEERVQQSRVIVNWRQLGYDQHLVSSHELEAKALDHEANHAFADALSIYRTLAGTRTVLTSRARCHLCLREYGEAIDYAQRALAIAPDCVAALTILTSAMLARGAYAEALRNAERLVELAGSGRAHYLRGKALFALGRMVDAHQAFEQATKLDPKLLEAQLLRREVERVTKHVNLTVGSQHAPTFDIPAQLAELRDVLISGDLDASIAALRDDRFARDADAQLLLARFLSFARRWDDAIAVYAQIEATSHRTAAIVGKATALLELGRAGDALSMFEQLPDDADAAEGAARALEALGRRDEAAEAYRRFIALASSGSDLRVRAAELALEELARRQ